MNLDDFPLSAFEVDCDGSGCGSDCGPHIHPPQDFGPPVAQVKFRKGKRVSYCGAQGITRLVMIGDDGA